jgi:hypothetical protein
VTLSNGSNLLSLLITRKEAGESFRGQTIADRSSGVPVYQAAAQKYDVAGFETDQFLAYIVSDLGVRQNLKIANSLAPSVQHFLAADRT